MYLDVMVMPPHPIRNVERTTATEMNIIIMDKMVRRRPASIEGKGITVFTCLTNQIYVSEKYAMRFHHGIRSFSHLKIKIMCYGLKETLVSISVTANKIRAKRKSTANDTSH